MSERQTNWAEVAKVLIVAATGIFVVFAPFWLALIAGAFK